MSIDTAFGGTFDQLIEQRDDRFATFDRKSLLSEILRVEKTFELLGRDQFPEDSLLDFDRNRFGIDKLATNLFAHPDLFFFALNVAVLDADLAAIGALQDVENFAQRRAFRVGQAAGNEHSIEIPDRQTVRFDVQLGMIKQRHRVQRIDVGDQVPAHAIGIDQFHHARFSDRLLVL